MIVALMVLQGIVGVAWMVAMFRTLFHLRRRGVVETGHAFPGPATFLRVVSDWLRDPAERVWRWCLAALTLTLLASSVAVAALSAA